jgi:acetylornithine deacetylase/succinyl-diaminopimelate desuccinylase-like protein
VFADDQVKITTLEDVTRGPASPLNPQLMRTIGRVTDTLWPNVPGVPTMVAGATDGRFLHAAGIPTYGVQGFFMDLNDFRAHGRDERMPVKSFYEGQTFLYELVKALSSTAQ